jgi:hypothetical protein
VGENGVALGNRAGVLVGSPGCAPITIVAPIRSRVESTVALLRPADYLEAFSQRQSLPQAAPSFGQPRTISRWARAKPATSGLVSTWICAPARPAANSLPRAARTRTRHR